MNMTLSRRRSCCMVVQRVLTLGQVASRTWRIPVVSGAAPPGHAVSLRRADTASAVNCPCQASSPLLRNTICCDMFNTSWRIRVSGTASNGVQKRWKGAGGYSHDHWSYSAGSGSSRVIRIDCRLPPLPYDLPRPTNICLPRWSKFGI